MTQILVLKSPSEAVDWNKQLLIVRPIVYMFGGMVGITYEQNVDILKIQGDLCMILFL